MMKVHSQALNQSLDVKRIIGHIKGNLPGPTVIYTAGLHGNEPAGIFALDKVLKEIIEKKLPVKGNIYALCGNMWALEHGIRYDKQDLNRLFTTERMQQLKQGNLAIKDEDTKEQVALYKVLNEILTTEKGPFYFMDLHTTSSETNPFLTVNDSLLNRKFTQQFPVPMILGIEEYLEGPLLSYINELGYVAFGFEGGRHDDLSAIENHVAFIYVSMAYAGCISKNNSNFDHHFQVLKKTSIDTQDIFEIFYRYEVQADEDFKMLPGFLNFQKIKKGEKLATSNGKNIVAKEDSRIFMPLYQSQGADGFFTIRIIPKLFLQLSATLRNWKADRILPLLPGVNWASKKHDVLLVNLKIARLFTKKIFHLLGYRSRQIDVTHLKVKNREAASRNKAYKNENWFKKQD